MPNSFYHKILQLRYIQMMRILYNMGNLAVFIAIAAVFIFVFIYFVMGDASMSIPVLIGLGILLLYIHNGRKDKAFLASHFEHVEKVYSVEYAAILLPFFIMAALHLNLYLLIGMLLLLYIIPHIHFSEHTFQGNAVINYVPSKLFEWKAGLRKTRRVPLFIYILAYLSVLVKFLPMFVLFICSTSLASFYDENEDALILEQYGSNAKQIFLNKLILHTKYLILAYAPVMGLSSVIYPDISGYNVLFLLNQIILLAFIITVKYKHYIPSYNPIQNSNFTATFLLLSALPGFFFIPLIYILVYYKKAINKINQFI